MRRFARIAVIGVALAGAACGPAAPPVAPAPAQPTYAVGAAPETLLHDAAAFGRLAAALRRDLEAEEAAGSPGDREARKNRRFDLALLDGLDLRWESANARLDQITAEEPDPKKRWMTGLTIRAWADARGAGPDAFRAALRTRIAAMPYADVADQLLLLRDLAAQLTPDMSRALIAEHVGPAARRGPISREAASTILFQRWAALRIAPVGAIITDIVSAAEAANR